MVVKINYNFVAVFLSICLVMLFCIMELVLPQNVSTSAEANAAKEGQVILPVAMYHHILTSPSRWNDYTISPDQFEEDLKYIKECGYTTVSAGELISWADEGTPLPEKPILITFDDGYESVYEYAFPLLKKYEMKAVVSIIGRYTDLFSDPNEPSHVNYAHLSWNQCREMKDSGLIEIQNHTYDMHSNTESKRYGIRINKGESEDAYKKALYEDIGGLNAQIKEELGESPFVFAYPFGALCKESKPILEELGFQMILTCEEKINVLSAEPEKPLVLKRFNRAHHYSTYDYYTKLGLAKAS